jgi:hypothetical protein
MDSNGVRVSDFISWRKWSVYGRESTNRSEECKGKIQGSQDAAIKN